MAKGKASVDSPIEIKQSVSQSQPKRKAAKGTVVVQVFKERLRLCWSYLGKRYFLYIGLPDSKVNRTVAEQKARQIELDIASGNFDESLGKYKPQQPKYTNATVDDLYKRFMAHKAADISDRTPENYRAAFKYLSTFFKDKPVIYIGNAADDFAAWLNSHGLAGVTVKTYLVLISAVWDWGIDHRITEINPWKSAIKRLKVAPKQKIKPFTREEIEKIIEAFKTDRHYHHYTDFVLFQFNTGCRTALPIFLYYTCLIDTSI
jgi:integrase